MNLFIASDIHGSSFYCQKMMERINDEGIDRILLLGDLLYHGPRNDLPKDYDPKKCIEYLNSIKDRISCVRGNCDAEVDQMVLDFPVMADYIMVGLDKTVIYASHGHHYNPASPFKGVCSYILLNGHTHIPAREEYKDFVYLNPGSVSIPKNNSCHSYMIYRDGTFIWKDLLNGKEYDSYKI